MVEHRAWDGVATAEEQAMVDREREYWDAHEDLDWVTDESKRQAIALIPDLGGDILELCIGSGTYSQAVPRTFSSYTGLDLSQSLLDRLRTRCPDIEPVKGNAEELPFDDAQYDTVLVFAGLHHLPRYERSIAESYRVLRPGGHFYCFEPNDRAWYRPPMRFMRDFIGIYSDDEVFLDPREVTAVMRGAGFSDLRVGYLTPKFKRGHLNAKNEVLAHLMYGAAALGTAYRTQSFFAASGRKPGGLG